MGEWNCKLWNIEWMGTRPEFHFYAIVDGTSDILKRGRRWRGFDREEAGKRAEESLFAFFGMNTG